MNIRIRFPEDRDYAGQIEVVGAGGELILGPFPAAGRAHNVPAAARGNESRSVFLPYGDTPTGTYAVRGVVESGPGTNLDGKIFGVHGVVLLEPIAGSAALADANGRFRLFIQGGDDGDLHATAGAVRLLDRDQRQLVAVIRRAEEQVFCEIITTSERGAKVNVSQLPLDSDPPDLPALPSTATLPLMSWRAANIGSPAQRLPLGARAFPATNHFFIKPEHFGSGGGTAYGGGLGVSGTLDGSGTGADVGADQPSVSDASPVSGASLAPAQEPVVTEGASGGSQLLSTAAPTGLSSPYSPAEGGWQVAPQQPTSLSAFIGADISAYTATPSDPGNPNPYTGTQNLEPYTGTDNGNLYTNSQTPNTTPVYGYTPDLGIHQLSPDELAAMKAASTPNPDIPYIGISATNQPSAPQPDQAPPQIGATPYIGISATYQPSVPQPDQAPPQTGAQGYQSTDAGSAYPPATAGGSLQLVDTSSLMPPATPGNVPPAEWFLGGMPTGPLTPSGPLQSVDTSPLTPPAAPGNVLPAEWFLGGMPTGPLAPSGPLQSEDTSPLTPPAAPGTARPSLEYRPWSPFYDPGAEEASTWSPPPSSSRPQPTSAGIDIFGFGAYTYGTPGPVRLEGEGVAYLGYDTQKGWWTGDLGVAGVEVGGEMNYVGVFGGEETTSTHPMPEVETLYEFAIGPEVPDVAGLGVGGGVYVTREEQGLYAFVQGGAIGEHGSLGVGIGADVLGGLIDWLNMVEQGIYNLYGAPLPVRP